MENRQHAVEHVGQVIGDVFELVGDGGFFRRGFVGLPAGGQGQAHAFDVGAALLRGQVAVDVLDQAAHDLAFLFQQRAADGFSGMGGEHRLHAQPRQQGQHGFSWHALVAQLAQRVFEATGLGRFAQALVVAAAADAVHAFGQVHGLEIAGEGAHQQFGAVQRQRAQAFGHVFKRGAGFAAADGGDAQGFDVVEETGRDLFGQDFTDQGAQALDVLAQQVVGGGQVDVAQGFGRLVHPGSLAQGREWGQVQFAKGKLHLSPHQAPQHFLYFLPLPQGQGSLRSGVAARRTGSRGVSDSMRWQCRSCSMSGRPP